MRLHRIRSPLAPLVGGGDKILLFRPPSPIPPWGGQGGVGGLGGGGGARGGWGCEGDRDICNFTLNWY
ncbi:MAG: hypothetical protein EAZ78_21470 [Oscillatoriales cyanobacterium]|nr:MAG: hypothetical protein EAZ98_16840 [Oscillatoriales cyanobacterium]TAE02583.1 MAG: hypothetical protein EAZ96_15560 [Oscillatoriales cyanobacterium]TAE99735.1 MAG: hypothetical protein EAZ78_21470 [Oscillatoriales cyanobacterium]TAF44735.1 MAG: hypothetical protein EAZ68_06005 [Oscillatoriales cyanobacterium]TAF70027.1 MAG: hypothetical protein EAZ59_06370 [Oscillatoriales cyanobacterium]